MVSIFDFNSYREYLAAWIQAQPNKGRGIKGQLARTLNVSPTLISFVLNGSKLLTLEQASDLADFIGLNETECDYLLILVEFERAGHHRLRQKLARKINSAQEKAKKISSRVKKDMDLTDEQKTIYYSSWIYTGIRNLVAIGEFKDAGSIAKRLSLPLALVHKAIQFLLENGLCVERNGVLTLGPALYTHTDADSPHANKHRQNWRLFGLNVMDQKRESDLFYTCPMSLSDKDVQKIRGLILSYVQEILNIMKPSRSEKVCCLNIDWFEY